MVTTVTRPAGLVAASLGPSLRDLRPLRAPTPCARFPVYPDLVDHLCADLQHPDETAGRVLATCAGYAYASGDSLQATADTVGMVMARLGMERARVRVIRVFVDAMFVDSFAILVQSADGRVVVVCYRGTQPLNLIDWLTDADVYREDIALTLGPDQTALPVHAGFYRNVRATRYQVIASLHDALDGRSVTGDGTPVPQPMQRLYLTGHSLGGAMASLLAVMLRLDPAYADATEANLGAALTDRLAAAYTFGQPMPCSPELARACDGDPFLAGRLLRYIYRRDIVPRLPPRDTGRYRHIGREFRYSGSWPWPETSAHPIDQMRTVVGIAEVPVAYLARRLQALDRLSRLYSIDDHLPHHYVAAMTPPGEVSEYGDDPPVPRAH